MDIINDFLVQTKIGLHCSYGDFYLDPKEPVVNAVISHAHADHAISGNQNVYCTKPTSLFMQHRYKKFAAGDFYIYNYQSIFEVNGVKLSFYAAGHMLGSSLVLMEYNGVRYLYTGDYKIEPDNTCEPINLINADVLITETTFANPATEHPNVIEEIKKLNAVQDNIMLGSYALGKSQRLIDLINKYCPDKRILVHHSIIPFVKIYEQLGVNLGKYEVYDRKVMKQNKVGMIYIVPPMVYNSYIRAINVVRVFATGWKHLQSQNEIQLYISDHVDWKDILATIDIVKPKEVWTLHGDGKQLKSYFAGKLEVKILN